MPVGVVGEMQFELSASRTALDILEAPSMGFFGNFQPVVTESDLGTPS